MIQRNTLLRIRFFIILGWLGCAVLIYPIIPSILNHLFTDASFNSSLKILPLLFLSISVIIIAAVLLCIWKLVSYLNCGSFFSYKTARFFRSISYHVAVFVAVISLGIMILLYMSCVHPGLFLLFLFIVIFLGLGLSAALFITSLLIKKTTVLYDELNLKI